MVRLLAVVLIPIMACTIKPSYEEVPFSNPIIDSLKLLKLIIENDELVGIVPSHLLRNERGSKIKSIVQSKSFRLKMYNSHKFAIVDLKECNGYQHLYILKERNWSGIDMDPFKQLFLVILDSNNNLIHTQKIYERIHILDMVSSTSEMNWELKKDSILCIKSESTFCSDIIDEDGDGLNCFEETKTELFKLKCDGITLEYRDSKRKSI